MMIVTHVIRRVLYVTVILGGSSSYTRDPEELAGGAPSRPVFLNLHHGGAVFCIEGSSLIDCIQAASCGRPSLRSPKPRFAATSSATARVKCAIVGGPRIGGSATRPSNTSAIRLARAISCAKTVGERSSGGRAISRTHTQMPSHMLRAENSSR